MEEIVKTEALVFEYTAEDSGTRALGGIDIGIAKGEFVAVLGHNGSGKSTLAKQINCLLQPTSGTVFVKGISTTDKEKTWDTRQSVGMVFQNPDNQIIATIVEEDVAFGPENLGVEPSEIRARVDEALFAVDMAEFAGRAPHTLSGGQKQRVAIAGILAMKPDVIVLDEATAMLDPIGRREVLEVARRLNIEEDITIIFITHYMDEAAKADRVIVMEDGLVALSGTPKEVFSQADTLRAIGLDVPQVVDIAAQLRAAGIPLANDVLSIEELLEEICRYKS